MKFLKRIGHHEVTCKNWPGEINMENICLGACPSHRFEFALFGKDEPVCVSNDIGKIGVPDAILKKQGPLSAEECPS